MLEPAYLDAIAERLDAGKRVSTDDIRKLLQAAWAVEGAQAEARLVAADFTQNLIQAEMELDRLREVIRGSDWKLRCGHPVQARLPADDEGGPVCAWCADVGALQEKVDLLVLAAAKRRAPIQEVPNVVLPTPAAEPTRRAARAVPKKRGARGAKGGAG